MKSPMAATTAMIIVDVIITIGSASIDAGISIFMFILNVWVCAAVADVILLAIVMVAVIGMAKLRLSPTT